MRNALRVRLIFRSLARALLTLYIILCFTLAPVVALAQVRAVGEELRVSVGALRFSSSGPLFLARERHYFTAEGLAVEIRFFEAAPTIAVAVASGDLTFGSAALTAAFFNLAADGRVVIIAGQAREERGYPGNLVLVTRRAHDAGIARLADLVGQPFGLTQYGSPSHYQLGQLARAHGISLSEVPIRAFQTLPNLVAALRADRVSWAIIAPPVAQALMESGHAVSLGAYSDVAGYQFGAIFAARTTVADRADVVLRFLRAYRRGIADYAELHSTRHVGSEEERMRAFATAALIARYVYPEDGPEVGARKVLDSAFFIDPSGEVDKNDLARQISWYIEQRLVRRHVEMSDILRLDLLRASYVER